GTLASGAARAAPLARAVRDQGLPVAVMPIGRGRADPGGAGGFREGEAGETALGNEVECRPDQRLAQIAVMITAPARRRPVSRPAHVRISYMNRATGGSASSAPGVLWGCIFGVRYAQHRRDFRYRWIAPPAGALRAAQFGADRPRG